jgi:nucleoside-diphosphate-sugar epimerase
VDEFIAPKKSVGLRFSTVWGDGARDTMLISKIKLGIVEYATTHTRDFVHVSDVVSAIQTVIDNPKEKGVYECGCGIAFKVDQLVAKNGFDVPVTDGEDFELESNVLPSTKLRSLGWDPKMNVMETKLR